MLKKNVAAIAITGFALLAVLCTAHHAMAQMPRRPILRWPRSNNI
jgi:hypothetical protein